MVKQEEEQEEEFIQLSQLNSSMLWNLFIYLKRNKLFDQFIFWLFKSLEKNV